MIYLEQKSRCILLISVFLSMMNFVASANVCEAECGDCDVCIDDTCVNRCYRTTASSCCSGGGVGICYNPTVRICCTDGGSAYICNKDVCAECGGGSCVTCGGDPDKACCDGTCYDIRTQGCCDGKTIYNLTTQKCCNYGNGKVCPKNDTCCQDECCDLDECCDDGECVDKCTNTSQCDWTPPSSNYAECENFDPTDKRCDEHTEGALCGHVINLALSDANCADCAPSCDKDRICACAEIIPVNCKTHCYLLVCGCLCDDIDYEDRSYSGDHYECAE